MPKVSKKGAGVEVEGQEPSGEPSIADTLTYKERLFVEFMIGESFFNATDAARRAGYKHPNVQGPRMLVKVSIRAAIDARVNEVAMTSTEIVARLNRIGRGDIDDVIDEDGRFDIEKARKGKKTGLLKKLKRKTTKKQVDAHTEGEDEEAETVETSVIHEEVEFEMYSAHEALRDLGKYRKLFTDKVEHTGKDGADLFKHITVEIVDPHEGSDE